MADAADGKRSLLVAAYLSQHPNLIRFFSLRTGSASEAEDIVQEIFLKIADLDGQGIENAAGFLFRLGTNIMLDRARSRRRGVARDGAYAQATQAPGSTDSAADAPSPEAAWEARATLDQVLDAVRRMPPRRRQVFIMHKLDGASYGEIAQRLGITRSAVEKLMASALKDLTKWKQ